MQNAGDFILEFSGAVYAAAIEDLERYLAYPMIVETEMLEITVSDRADLGKVTGTLRSGLKISGVEQMVRKTVSVSQTGDGTTVVTQDTKRFGADGQDMGMHRSAFTLNPHGETWKCRKLSVLQSSKWAPEGSPGTTILYRMRRRFVIDFWREPNARWFVKPRDMLDVLGVAKEASDAE